MPSVTAISVHSGEPLRLSPPKYKPEITAAFDDIFKVFYHLDGPFFMMEVGDGVVTLELKPWDGGIRLSLISVPEQFRGKGYASKAMKVLTQIADKHGVKMTLDAAPQGDDGLNKAQLFKWYERHGFHRLPYTMQKKLSDAMERPPKKLAAIVRDMLKVASEVLSS